MTVEEEHKHLQTYLLMLKYYYYEEHTSIIPDVNFDMCEKFTKELQNKLGIAEDEDYPTDMVGFSKKSSFWELVKEKYKFVSKNLQD